jgi:hypothetical protein
MRIAAFGVLFALASTATAQLPPLATGARLKIDGASRQRLEGTLMAQSPDSLTIAAAGAVITSVPASAVGRIQASQGKSRGAGAKKGAKIGAIIGGGLGVLVGAAFMNETRTTSSEFGDGASAPLAFGLVGAAEGALYGLIIGAIAGAEKWTTVYERPVRFGVLQAGNRPALGFSLRY